MKFTTIFLPMLAMVPVVASAGQITGTLFKDGKPASELKIQLKCDNGEAASVQLDATAGFYFYVKQSSICYIEVVDLGLSHKVYSYETPVNYDFDLLRQADGSYLIRRH